MMMMMMMMMINIISGLDYYCMVSHSLWQIGGPIYGNLLERSRDQEGIKTTGGIFPGMNPNIWNSFAFAFRQA